MYCKNVNDAVGMKNQSENGQLFNHFTLGHIMDTWSNMQTFLDALIKRVNDLEIDTGSK